MEYPPRLATLLELLEAELRRLDLWESRAAPGAALDSPNPFCCDTLSLPQWLQWVFIPRMRDTLKQNLPLAAACQVAPAAELYFQETGADRGALLVLLAEFDTLMPVPKTC